MRDPAANPGRGLPRRRPALAALTLLLAGLAAPAAANPGTDPGADGPAVVGVRFGRHPGFDRLVFDWPRSVALEVERSGEADRLVFTTAARFRLDGIERQLGGRILGARAAGDGAGRAFVLERRPGTELRWFSLPGNRVVVDIADPAAPRPPAAPAPPRRR
ncbi:MAG TPA: hypothetical protein VFG47_22635, partial [Geminicoccaceae bacterium]|nr:hypothetical protein [Geminicoccaceae bacterium]